MHGIVSSGLALGAVISGQLVWQSVATALGSAAVYAQKRAEPEREAIEELTMRLQKPAVWAARHPVQAIRRKADRRQV